MEHCSFSRTLVSDSGVETKVHISYVDWLDADELVDCGTKQDGSLEINISSKCNPDAPTRNRISRCIGNVFSTPLSKHITKCMEGEEFFGVDEAAMKFGLC